MFIGGMTLSNDYEGPSVILRPCTDAIGKSPIARSDSTVTCRLVIRSPTHSALEFVFVNDICPIANKSRIECKAVVGVMNDVGLISLSPLIEP